MRLPSPRRNSGCLGDRRPGSKGVANAFRFSGLPGLERTLHKEGVEDIAHCHTRSRRESRKLRGECRKLVIPRICTRRAANGCRCHLSK
jgi:hypothetical protein